MILSVYYPVGADFSATSKITTQKEATVIDEELTKILENAASDDLIPVDIWFYEVESQETREQKVKSVVGINKETLVNSKADTISADKVDSYITTERSLYAKKQAEFYASFQKEYNNIKGLQSTKDNKRLFLSQYAPMLGAELSPAEIKNMAKDSRVEKIYYSSKVELKPEMDISLPLLRVPYTRDTLGYTGSGVKIGLIEADALPDRTKPYFTYSNIIYDPNVSTDCYDDTHANMVAAIMVAKSITIGGVTYRGIAPEAELYATYYISGDYDDWRVRVEWLLSQGLNVINMSAGFKNAPGGQYCTHEKWLDHVAINHSVHFVKSAGNTGEGDGKISCPGMAYNIITVGAFDDKNTATHSDDVIAGFSSSVELDGCNNKPDLVAPGSAISTPAGPEDGTSFSAPHVTAIIAQLCQRQPSLKVLQDAVKAILTASVNHSKLCFTLADDKDDDDIKQFDIYGAGAVDSQAAFYTVNHSRYLTSSFAANSANGAEKEFTFYVSPTDTKIRISLSWLKNITISSPHATSTSFNEHTVADLDLHIYDPTGAKVAYSASWHNNTEIVDFVPSMSGTYKIVVRQYSKSTGTVFFGLAWW